MDKKVCYIVGAGSFSGLLTCPKDQDLVIAADGGFRYLQACGLKPDALIGDFDSLGYIPEHKNLIRHSPIKDDTDMALAAAYGEQEGYRTFVLYGGLGKRLDHTMGNLQLISGLSQKGYEAYLIGEGMVITALTSGELVFPASYAGTISVFSAGDQAEGVSEEGLKYSLQEAVLTNRCTLGVSNEFLGQPSRIRVAKGTLWIMWQQQEAGTAFPQQAAAYGQYNCE